MRATPFTQLPVDCSWVLHTPQRGWKKALHRLARVPFLRYLFLSLRLTRDTVYLAREFYYDFTRVLRHSSAVFTGNTRSKLAALITMGYHGIEKALTLPAPRPGFGRQKVYLLIDRLERYVSQCGVDETSVVALNVLRKYCHFNAEHGALDSALLRQVELLGRRFPPEAPPLSSGGCRVVSREDFLRQACVDLTDFFASRCSVRQYSNTPVALQDVETAVDLARKTPSCCNRQSSRVWVLQKRSEIQQALCIQGGARGFCHEVTLLLIVTSDISCFHSPGERGQALIDGGMFAMTLVYALHSLGLVTCCLAWSKTHDVDQALRVHLRIPPQETIVLLLAVGHPKDSYSVADSHRRSVQDLMTVC